MFNITKPLMLFLTFSASSVALAELALNATTISVEKNCNSSDESCFPTIAAALDWTYNTRSPSPSKDTPLVINIGVGAFDETINCNSVKHITFNGAGIKRTTINKAKFQSCKNITISNMTFDSPNNVIGSGILAIHAERGMEFINSKNITANNLSINNTGIGIYWDQTNGAAGTNISNWTNIHVTGSAYAWFDSPSGCGTHNYFASTFTSLGNEDGQSAAFYSACADNWIFGSQINATPSQDAINTSIAGIKAPAGEIHVYGSNIRVLAGASTNTATLIGASALTEGEIHIHGTGIDVIGKGNDAVVSLYTDQSSLIHASASAYVLKTGNEGSSTRIDSNGGDIKAPYTWHEQATPPNISSQTGADMVVITSTTDNQPHLTIYSNNCDSKWYDTATSSCMP